MPIGQSLAPPPVGESLEPPPPTNPASKDLRVLLTLRHKTKTISKGKVTADALEDAIRVRGEHAATQRAVEAGIAEAKYGTGKKKAPHLEFSVAELKQEVGVSADVEAWRRTKQYGIEDLVAPEVKNRRLSHMSTEAGANLLQSLEQHGDGRRKSVADAKPPGSDGAQQPQRRGSIQQERRNSWKQQVQTPRVLDKQLVQAAFKSQDESGSGFLKFEQVHGCLKKLGFNLSVDEVTGFAREIGVRPSSSVDPQEFSALVGMIQESKPAQSSPNELRINTGSPRAGRQSNSSSSSSSGSGSDSDGSLGTSGSSYTDWGYSSSDGEYSVGSRSTGTYSTTSSKRMDRARLRSPRATNDYADEMLQNRLKAMERELRVKIDKDKGERETRFRRDLQKGKIMYIAPEKYMPEQRALYSGPVGAKGVPEGVGCFDYKRFVETRGHVVAERRVYYAGVVVEGMRQGLGLLRWLDQTEYCGSWDGDVPHGSGLETYTDGSWYAGGFYDDKRHGMGGVWTNKGMVYLGQWNRGVRHGIGIIGHTDVVQVDRKGKGELQQVTLSVDMSNMKMNHPFPPLSNRRGEMREDVMRSIFNKRYMLDAAKKVVPYFIVEYDRGVQSRSIWYNDTDEHHKELWRDAVHAAMSSQMVALEALELAKEGLRVRRQAVQANAMQRKREQQNLIRTERAKTPRLNRADDTDQSLLLSPSLATTQPLAEVDVLAGGLRVDQLNVTVVGAKELQSVEGEDDITPPESDIFVVVTLDDVSRTTRGVSAASDPVWDETFSFAVTSAWSDLVCSVYRTRPSTDTVPRAEVLFLRVTVVEARGLKSMDAGGSSDPYAVVQVGEQKFTTNVVKKSLNPEWHATFELAVEDATQKVQISVWDHDMIGADDLIGKLELSLDGRSGRPGGQEWHDLMDGSDRHGQIFVSLQLPEWTDWSRGDFLGEVRVPVSSVDPQQAGSLLELGLQTLRPDRGRLERRRRVLSDALLNWTWNLPKNTRWSAHVVRVFLVQWQMIVRGLRLRRSTSVRYELQDGLRKVSHDRILNLASGLHGMLQLKVDAKSSLEAGEHSGAAAAARETIEAARSKDDGIGLLRVKVVCGQRLPVMINPARVWCKLSLGKECGQTSAQTCFPSAAWNDEYLLPLHAGAANLRIQLFREEQDGTPGEDCSLGELSVATTDLVLGEPRVDWYPIQHSLHKELRLLVRVIETRGLVKHQGLVFATIELGSMSCSTPPCRKGDFKEHSQIPYSFQARSMDDTLRVSTWQQTGDAAAVFVGECVVRVKDIVHHSRPDTPYDRWHPLQERVSATPEVVWGELHLLVSLDSDPPPRQGELKLEMELLKEKDPVAERPPRPSPKLIPKGGLAQITVHEAFGLNDVDVAGVFCELRVAKHATRTQILDNARDAVWDTTFLMDTPLNPQTLRATVMGRMWLLRLHVVRATDLKAMDVGGTSDPYVVIKLGNSVHQSAVVKKNLNPTWDETFEIVVQDSSLVLDVSVWDKDLIGADDLIGKTEIPLRCRAGQGRSDEWYDLCDDGDKNGSLLVGLEVVPSRPEDSSSGGEQALGYVDIDLQELDIGAKMSSTYPLYMGETHYTLSVAVLEGNGLMPVDAIASDPYVIVTVESQTFTTPVIKQECDPVWKDQCFTFRVSSLDTLLTCQVYDYNAVQAHVFMGRYTISAADIAQGEVHEKACPLQLKPDQRDAVQRRVKAGESLGSLKLAYKLVETRVPSCSLHLSIVSMHPPEFSRPHRNQRLIAYRAARGVGTLELTVVGGRGVSGYGHHGTFCEVLVGEESTTSKEVKGGHNPAWDEAHSYTVAPGTASATVRVLCKGKRGRLLLLGEAVILLSDLHGKGEVDVWNRLDGRYKLGRLLVRVQSAAGVIAADPSGTSDPFAEVTVGKRKKVTKVKKKTLDPVWEEEMLFDVWSVLDTIKIEVYDWDRVSNNDLLGLVEVPMERVLRMCKDGERLGEGHADAGLVLPLTGINGTPFVDEDRLQRATGTVSIEVEFRGDYGLRRKVGWLRTVANYVSPALSLAQAADMDMALVDQRQADEDDALGGDSALEELEHQIQEVIKEDGSGKLLTRKMIARPGLNPNSLQAQIDLYTAHGGKVLGPYAAGVVPADDSRPRVEKRRGQTKEGTSKVRKGTSQEAVQHL